MLDNAIAEFIAQNKDLNYHPDAFRAACEATNQGTETEYWSRELTDASTMEQMIEAVPEGIQMDFLKAYADFFRNKLLTI